MEAGAEAGKNSPKNGPYQMELEVEPLKDIYKNGSNEPGSRSFLEGAGAGR